MSRPFDHLVIASRDLAAQAAFYTALGFRVGPLNQHPWGTQNHIVDLQGGFLELIGIAPGALMPALYPAPDEFSFGGFVGQYLKTQQGIAMLALQTQDAVVDAADYAGAGLGAFRPFHFGRPSMQADKRLAQVSFTLAFARSALIDRAGFFSCQHHQPRISAMPAHPNGAQKLNGLVMVAEYPADHAEFLGHFTGQRAMLSTSMGVEITSGGSTLEVLTPLATKFRYGLDVPNQPHFCACRIGVAHLDALRASLTAAGIATQAHGAFLLVQAMGTSLVFEQLPAA